MKKLTSLLAALALLVPALASADVFHTFGPANGVQKCTTASPICSAAAISDILGLATGSCSITVPLRGDGSCGTVPSTSVTGLGTFATQNYATPPAIGSTTPAAGAFTTLSATGNTTTNITGSTQCVHANTSGVLSGTGSDCGAGSGNIPVLQTAANATSITPAPTSGTDNLVIQANTQGAGTLTVNAPTGSPIDGQLQIFRISSTAVQTFSWNAIYNAPSANLGLPTSSSSGGLYDYIAFRYNATTAKWNLLAVTYGAAAPQTVAQGGTGDTTLPAHGVLLGEGTSPVGNVTAMAADTLLQGQGATSDPAAVSVPSCANDGAHGLVYSTSTHTFTCASISGGGTASDVQSFTTAGANTWTKPSGSPKYTRVILCSGGGGGGSGGNVASGTAVSGGGSGGGGTCKERVFSTSSLGATETVTLGAGGTGATGVASGTGNTGGNGGNSTFGSWMTAYGSGAGTGGASAATSTGGGSGGFMAASTNTNQGSGGGQSGTAGSGGNQPTNAVAGGSGAGSPANGNQGNAGGGADGGASGGGSGGGITTTPTASAGGASGATAILAAVNGGSAGVAGTAGATSTAGYVSGTGGGGGGSSTSANGGAGGNGARGGGGGGGGAALSGSTSGAGGNGGDGYGVAITTY